VKLTLRLDYGQGAQEVDTDLLALVRWERFRKAKVSSLADGVGIEDLCFLAHDVLVRRGAQVPAKLDDFVAQLLDLEAVEAADPTPTNRARTGA
jgi:hypothetical protein